MINPFLLYLVDIVINLKVVAIVAVFIAAVIFINTIVWCWVYNEDFKTRKKQFKTTLIIFVIFGIIVFIIPSKQTLTKIVSTNTEITERR